MTVRVNRRYGTVADYQQRLRQVGLAADFIPEATDALRLATPVGVQQLPEFDQGHVSVQDAAAQLAGAYLQRHACVGGRLLDACAAPGGKTAHALELGSFSQVVALDQDALRLQRVAQTLTRLGFDDSSIQLQAVDASEVTQWWDGQAFDAVLLDAPCSGTGVIRRHPDIKLLRRDSDLATLVGLQALLMDRLWTTLKPGGFMLYATCSILKTENEQQVVAFLERTHDALLLEDTRQILPGENDMDGFFYAPLRKQT
ncbi:unnamed protein product [Cyprideis torosa]|uniref:Uncharacterized protein n=1 Tax=Cyprideis torosa TaxID=163714 RepID=A0A7R8WZU6_9CRUS|nr:unnamed protein product [Cyprideis torosa]CAG0910513.1 unnamed protein product [Cyprideis torosa]